MHNDPLYFVVCVSVRLLEWSDKTSEVDASIIWDSVNLASCFIVG